MVEIKWEQENIGTGITADICCHASAKASQKVAVMVVILVVMKN